MIIFLYGRDLYRLKQNLEKIIDEYQKKYSGLALSVLDINEVSELKKLEDVVKTVSFFDEKRLVVIKNAFEESEKIIGLIKNWDLANDKQRILVFVEDADDTQLTKRNKELFSLMIATPNMVKRFEPLEGKKLESWVTKEFESMSAKAEPAAIQKLISFVGPDIWRLAQEINKLTNYKDATCNDCNDKITVSDVELLVNPKEDLNIFQVVDAVANKNKLKAASLLYHHLWAGEDPYYIFSMITYQFRNLLRVKSMIKNAVAYAGIVKKTGLNPFVVKKTFDQCRKYDLDELQRLFASLARLDIEAKSGLTDMEDGLYKFVFYL